MPGRVLIQDGQVIPIPFLNDLFQDVALAEDRIEASQSASSFRDLVRATFALHEGILDWFRGVVSQYLVGRMYRYDELEIAKLYLISTVSHQITKQGKLKKESARRPFLNDLAFVIRTGAECWHLDPSHFFSDVGWERTQCAIHVRHRITHPKRNHDLRISANELEVVRDSLRWLLWVIDSILKYADEVNMGDIDAENGVVRSDLNEIFK